MATRPGTADERTSDGASSVRYRQRGVYDTEEWGETIRLANYGTVFVTDEAVVCGFGTRVTLSENLLNRFLLGVPRRVGLFGSSEVRLERALGDPRTVRVPLSSVGRVEFTTFGPDGHVAVLGDGSEDLLWVAGGGTSRTAGDAEVTRRVADEIATAATATGGEIERADTT